MERENIKELLRMMGIDKIVDRGNWVSASCPFAEFEHEDGIDYHPSFGISVGERSVYNCFTCGKKGPLTTLSTSMSFMLGQDMIELRDFISRHEGLFITGDREREERILDPIKESILDSYKKFTNNIGSINKESIELWELKFDPAEYRLIFPVRDKFGRLVGIRGRFMGTDDGVLKYRSYSELNPSGDAKRSGVWYGMHFPLSKKPIVLVEGERDAILLKQTGISNVWASMGASISVAQIESLRSVNNYLYMYFDNDSSGREAEKTVYKKCRGLTRIYSIDNHYGTKDPAEAVEKGVINKALKAFSLKG